MVVLDISCHFGSAHYCHRGHSLDLTVDLTVLLFVSSPRTIGHSMMFHYPRQEWRLQKPIEWVNAVRRMILSSLSGSTSAADKACQIQSATQSGVLVSGMREIGSRESLEK